ncbi:hypothetical protein [Pontibacter liquoris]|uniref:hypothetical protein n=1 Tax=Pontibacter liquoris TaxID=2905677 RepID=UPI001FA6DD06|nr:hypothetical protein [Pontibacter liquoris]
MEISKAHFVSYYRGPYDLNKRESLHLPSLGNRESENEKFFDPLKVLQQQLGYDPRRFIYELIDELYVDTMLEFKKLRIKHLPRLREKYQLDPQFEDFLEWYMIHRYEPLIRRLRPKILWTVTTSFEDTIPYRDTLPYRIEGKLDLPLSFRPSVTIVDLLAYSRKEKEETDEIERQFIDGVPIHVKYIEQHNEVQETLHWLGTEAQLRTLYHTMEGKQVKCSFEVFAGVLGMGEYAGPVTWTGGVRELIILIKFLRSKIFIEIFKEFPLTLVQSLFIRKTGNIFSYNSLKTTSNDVGLDSLTAPLKDLINKISENL